MVQYAISFEELNKILRQRMPIGEGTYSYGNVMLHKVTDNLVWIIAPDYEDIKRLLTPTQDNPNYEEQPLIIPFFQGQPSNNKTLVDLWNMLQETL